MNILRTVFAVAFTAFSIFAKGAAPAGYYDSAANKYGRNLLQALNAKVGPHTNVGYDGLLTLYKTTDARPNGTVWDMYSTKEWQFGNTCGNYKNVGDCYNREHSFPKSWFSEGSPMKSDAFHVYPTDGKVNGQRSNYPYGECANGTYLPANGSVKPLGKLGASTFPGYSGKVFEPDDEYKGDFARSYFYMAAAYYDKISGWDSPMLAGNNFPAFSTWAVNLLLKWHRQDPVSDKETARNDAVYARQNNRNPFIDHPELVEHIWGNKSTTPWTPGSAADPEIVLPAEGTSLDFGSTALQHGVSRTITVRTAGTTASTSVSVSGATFSCSASTLQASATGSAAGTTLSVTFKPVAEGTASGTLTLSCGALRRTVSLTGRGIDGLPAGPARYITDESFDATWVYIGDDIAGKYTLDVYGADGTAVDGYPRQVPARDGSYTVDGLEHSTTYIYTVASSTLESEPVTVTTGEPVPSIEFLFDGDLYFTANPGEVSEVAELLMDVDNIDTDITVTIGSPFEVSADRSNWGAAATVSPDQGRIYLRMNAATEGSFSATLLAKAGDYVSEGVTVEGLASSTPDFLEDFDTDATNFGTYSPNSEFQGSAARWVFSNTGIWASDPAVSDPHAPRFGKNSDSYIAMAEDRTSGAGTVSFQAKYWGSESDPVIAVQFSTDGGQTWKTAGNVTVATSSYREYSVFVGQAGKVRIRLQQTAGQRLNIDDVAITRYASGVADPEAPRHAWDAHASADGTAIVVTVERTTELGVYALDGNVLLLGELAPGIYTVDATAGLYIIASSDFSRRVLLR